MIQGITNRLASACRECPKWSCSSGERCIGYEGPLGLETGACESCINEWIQIGLDTCAEPQSKCFKSDKSGSSCSSIDCFEDPRGTCTCQCCGEVLYHKKIFVLTILTFSIRKLQPAKARLSQQAMRLSQAIDASVKVEPNHLLHLIVSVLLGSRKTVTKMAYQKSVEYQKYSAFKIFCVLLKVIF